MKDTNIWHWIFIHQPFQHSFNWADGHYLVWNGFGTSIQVSLQVLGTKVGESIVSDTAPGNLTVQLRKGLLDILHKTGEVNLQHM